MNPFRSRKKPQHGVEGGILRSSTDEQPPMPRGMTFRRKKPQPEPKIELDLASALPSRDDFRTSLLMPNLSARFSMLRDQDDPNSKIGKANDDSVLYPNRHSRMNLSFGQTGLSDIAEVSSLASSSLRPPFAYNQTDSYVSTDGYDTDGDSQHGVMSRSKPGAGNKFFGGRQKIYKIPVGGVLSSKELNSPESGSESPKPMGKAVYDDDIAMSAFQALRAKEKEERKDSNEYMSSSFGYGERSSNDNDRRRETSSSTTSGPADVRTSTAATSVASQSASSLYGLSNSASTSNNSVSTVKQSGNPPSERSAPKNKRLYGQGLDQHIHEQQSSAMHRLDSIQRTRNGGFNLGKNIIQSRSATGLNDKFARAQPLYASNNFRAGSPPPSADTPTLAGFDFGMPEDRLPMQGRENDPAFGRSPPLSPPMSPSGDNPTFLAALEPNDVGKATASGAFMKPKSPYNEQQFAQRQLQLQEGRETPPLRAFSRHGSDHDDSDRLRKDSSASAQSGQSAKASQNSQHGSHSEQAAPGRVSPKKERPAHVDPFQAANGTYLSGFSGSESNSEPSSPVLPTLQPTTHQSLSKAAEDANGGHRYQHSDQHPAFQNQSGVADRSFMDLSESPGVKFASEVDAMPGAKRPGQESRQDIDSPTLGEEDGLGLNGLIKSHLRNISNVSSVYPNSPPRPSRRSSDVDGNDHHDSYNGNHWESDQWNDINFDVANPSQTNEPREKPAPLSLRARQILEQATQLRNASPKVQQVLGAVPGDKAQQILGEEAPRRSQESTHPPWQEQLRAHHQRGMSNDTQKERDEFANELADRRKRVKDNLKSFVETDGGAASPALGHRQNDSPIKQSGALGLLKKASREALSGRGDSKAKKMLGISMNGTPQASPQMMQDGFLRESEDRSRATNGYPRGVKPPSKIPEPARIGAGAGPSFRDRSIGAERRDKHRQNASPSMRPLQERAGSASRTPGQERSTSRPRGQERSISESERQNARQDSPSAHGFATKTHNYPTNYSPAGHTRKYSPPRDAAPNYPPPRDAAPNYPPPRDAAPNYPPPSRLRANSKGLNSPILPSTSQFPTDNRSRSNSKGSSSPLIQSASHFPTENPYSTAYPAPVSSGRQARVPPTPQQPNNHNISPPRDDRATSSPNLTYAPAFPPPSRPPPANPRLPSNRKQSINKSDISEPYFISATSNATTVDLPAGASLNNGMDEVRAEAAAAPPVPPFNPRRRRGIPPQNTFTSFSTRPKDTEAFPAYDYDHSRDGSPQQRKNSDAQHSGMVSMSHNNSTSSTEELYEERSTFSADEADEKPSKLRARLRKSSSEGGSMAAKARHQALIAATVPVNPALGSAGGDKRNKGGMF